MKEDVRKNIRHIMIFYSLMLSGLICYIIYFALVYSPKIATMSSNYIIRLKH